MIITGSGIRKKRKAKRRSKSRDLIWMRPTLNFRVSITDFMLVIVVKFIHLLDEYTNP
jgi:hypothetical protein